MFPLSDEMISAITRLQLGRIEKRILENHKIPFTYEENVIHLIVERCSELESGGRMIDSILTNTMLPEISAEFLNRLVEGKEMQKVHVNVLDSEFTYVFDDG